MELMEIRRRILMMPHVRTIGGLPVYVDDNRLGGTSGTLEECLRSHEDYFVVAYLDTGSPDRKSLTFTLNPQQPATNLLVFNATDGSALDYWSQYGSNPSRTLTTPGRYIAVSVYKPIASDFYIYDNTNQRYVIKGKNVR